MVHSEGQKVKKITVADPSRILKVINLKLNAPFIGSGSNFKAVWNEEEKCSEINIELPQEENAGKSVILEI